MRRLTLLPLIALPLIGCAVGPNYEQPTVALPGEYADAPPTSQPTSQPTTRGSATAADLPAWWRTLGDPALDRLVVLALRGGLDLEVASSRLDQARARAGISTADLLPTPNATASILREQLSAADAIPQFDRRFTTYQVGFDASWEIDVFGGLRRSRRAAVAEAQAAAADVADARVTLAAEVARNYVSLRSAQARLAVADESVAAQRALVELTKIREKAGLSGGLDAAQAEALLAGTLATLPPLRDAQVQAANRVAVLVGVAPGNLPADVTTSLGTPGDVPLTPVIVPESPAQMLRRRPDVAAAERQLAADAERVGVAVAEYFPKFSLTGSIAQRSIDSNDVFNSSATLWSFGPQLSWRLLDFYRLDQELRQAKGIRRQRLAEFRRTVLVAVEEVSTALRQDEGGRERVAATQRAVTAQADAVALAEEQYKRGLTDFISVLDARRELYTRRDALVLARADAATAGIQLFKSLGGGW